jgi:hypothetical protein
MDFMMIKKISASFVLLLTGCNAYIGQAKEYSEQPWYFLAWFTFFLLTILPFISTWFVIKASKAGLVYKKRVQKYLNYSVLLLIALCVLHEMSLTPRTNIRFDLLVIIPCVITQIIAVFSGWFNVRTVINFKSHY